MTEDLSQFHMWVHNFGPTTNRPTVANDGVSVGQPYFDTTLDTWIQHIGNDVWIPTSDANGAGAKNYLMNGDFSINQRRPNTATALSAAQIAYPLDRWLGVSGAAATSTFTPTDIGLGGFVNSNLDGDYATKNLLRHQATGHVANDTCRIEQQIPNVNTLAGKWITASGFVYSITGTQSFMMQLAQHYGSGGTPHAQIIYNSNTFNLPVTTWVYVNMSVLLDANQGYVLGTDGLDSLLIRLYPNRLTNTNIDVYYANFQIEEGRIYRGFHKRSFQDELEDCKRFYQKTFNYNTLPASAIASGRRFWANSAASLTATSTSYASIPLEKEMFKMPTAVCYNPSVVANNQPINYSTGTSATGFSGDATQNTKVYNFAYAPPASTAFGHLMGGQFEFKADFND